jgi:hypothetical protein
MLRGKKHWNSLEQTTARHSLTQLNLLTLHKKGKKITHLFTDITHLTGFSIFYLVKTDILMLKFDSVSNWARLF